MTSIRSLHLNRRTLFHFALRVTTRDIRRRAARKNIDIPPTSRLFLKPAGNADLLSDAKEGSFNGYWKAQYVAVGDGTILAEALGEDAKLYIDGLKAALGGQRFGNVIRDFTLENGTLTLTEGDMTLTLALQSDGFLRLTIAGNDPVTIYLMAFPVPDRPAENP